MKKGLISLFNIAIMVGLIITVVLYTKYESSEKYSKQVVSFEHSTIAMESVTENYLEGEQNVCDVWSHYINAKGMSLKEAVDFVANSHVSKTTSAHFIYADTLTGLSTRSSVSNPDNYEVSYKNYDLFKNIDWISPLGESINISRAFTNPINGEQSLAFCNRVNIVEEGESKEVLLLRIVSISDLKEKWAFPQDEFEEAEITIIDSSGNYIIKGNSFKNSDFFEFYKSYNDIDPSSLEELKNTISNGSGSFEMKDSHGQNGVIAYTPVESTNGWVMLGYIPEEGLVTDGENWILVGIVTIGMGLLFIVDLIYMMNFNRQLQKMTNEAEKANKAKTDFLSTMSHDIRTPMNAIMGLTTITEKNIDNKEVVKDNLRKISMSSNHLLTLINDILDISKVESGKLNLSPLTFSIVESVENLVNLSQPMVKEKNIDFNFRINKMEKEYLYADQLRLNQIFINILSNAIKYTQPSGTVSVDMSETDSEKDGYVKLTYIVSDNGMGMSKEYMERMYQPFSRQVDSRVNAIQGTGLGLAITKQMVDLMEGTIECQSELNKGTTFKVELDLKVAEKQPEDMNLNSVNVLIVDDDEILLETAIETLKSLGANGDKAENALTALEMIKKKQYDVVILDWKMPEIDGIETVRRIRQEIDKDIPVLLISAYDWSDIEIEAKKVGVNGFISKPLFRSTLYEKISNLLGVESKSIEPEDDYSDIAGLNILIAEDNDINWEIIQAMLNMFGITSKRAENGKIALEKMKQAKEGEYALIFMDIQMPEMNGLNATREIRKLDNKWANSIPIIAMTADAFSENITECLNAGMNGHIAKPIDIKLVIKEIRKIMEERNL